MEHTTLHLLYSRFWHKFLYDIGVVPTPEPYSKRTSHGLVLGEGGEKMSKSRGNVVNPDEMVEKHGADAFRLYEMFMGAFDQPIPWSTEGLKGMRRFLGRVWDLKDKVSGDAGSDPDTNRLVHQTIRDVAERVESMKFNTAIAALMTLANHLGQLESVAEADWERFVLMLAPFAPHVAEEMWELLGHSEPLAKHPWPEFDAAAAAEDRIEVPVQVNGKLRAKVTVAASAAEGEVKEMALEAVAKYTEGKEVRKVIYADRGEKKLVSVVVK
jgi:leucyl-tRNA synthetase